MDLHTPIIVTPGSKLPSGSISILTAHPNPLTTIKEITWAPEQCRMTGFDYLKNSGVELEQPYVAGRTYDPKDTWLTLDQIWGMVLNETKVPKELRDTVFDDDMFVPAWGSLHVKDGEFRVIGLDDAFEVKIISLHLPRRFMAVAVK